MILTLLGYPRLNKLNTPFSSTKIKLANGEQYLIQTVDKKLALTTHRLILKQLTWSGYERASVLLEDIQGWEVKATGKNLYFGLSLGMALMVYFNDSFALLSGFFLMLYMMTRHNRVHVKSRDKVLILPLEVEERRITNLIEMVRKAKHVREAHLNDKAAA